MKKKIIVAALIVVLTIAGLYWAHSVAKKTGGSPITSSDFDPKNASYHIEGTDVVLVDGKAMTPIVPGSASVMTTSYFGNLATGELNDDGKVDSAYLLTQDSGGSGTFYYVVSALTQPDGKYIITDAVLLGDRIAPQTTEIRGGKLYVNYTDRKPGEAMTVTPSVGVTKTFFPNAKHQLTEQ